MMKKKEMLKRVNEATDAIGLAHRLLANLYADLMDDWDTEITLCDIRLVEEVMNATDKCVEDLVELTLEEVK